MSVVPWQGSQRRAVSWLGLIVVFVLFGLPLFFGLRTFDFETDEAFYSYGVDRILEVGDWLEPKYSPSEEQVFLEKPPLKFWIVAGPIKVGLLPWNEFGLRFWDALFGAIGFLYVFAIGCRLAGRVCGFVAVLLLFVHGPLLFEHGLRTNNMEASLFLCYCAGVFHFLKWAEAAPVGGRGHAYGVGLYFVLGFMTKFVAAIFLPVMLVGAALVQPVVRRKLFEAWKLWLAVSGVALLLIAPWFIYAQLKFGNYLWEVMLRDHIYTRFTTSLNPEHVKPWTYYCQMLFQDFAQSGAQWLIAAGLVLLLVQLVRRRSLEEWLVVAWMVPLVLISSGSSKLYHYVYPFLPPFTLAAGYLVAFVMALAPPLLRRALAPIEQALHRLVPALRTLSLHPWVRISAIALISIAAALAIGSLAVGTVNVRVGGTTLIKSSGLVRPIVAILLFAMLTRRSAAVATLVVGLALAATLPAVAYRQTLPRLVERHRPMGDARDCVLAIQQSGEPNAAPGLYVDAGADAGMWHPIYYNFRRVQPWTRQLTPSPEQLDRRLHDAASRLPSLVWEERYQQYLSGPERGRFAAPAATVKMLQYDLLLPGPYARCGAEPMRPEHPAPLAP